MTARLMVFPSVLLPPFCGLLVRCQLTDAVEAAYRHRDMLDKRRPMMQDWATSCDNSVKIDDVVPLLQKTALR